MSSVYLLSGDGRTSPMARVRCKNEDRELQQILEANPNLLPGGQITPDDPRRWFLLKREMPVPDPTTGSDRWSIDFLFADQDAIPTFVECKRFADTRARREIVGQMLEYAANGHHYWSKEALRELADESARAAGTTLEQNLAGLRPTDSPSADEYFEAIQQNLREGQLRIVFFLEDSPMELRSVVDFLNRQMERSEVLLIEARQYRHEGMTIVVPTLFGYTEEARMVKKVVTVSSAGRRSWNRDAFFSAAETLPPDHLAAVEALYDFSLAELGCQVSWGTGLRRGSFNVKEPTICVRSVISCYTDGELTVNLGWLHGSESADWAKARLSELAREELGFEVPSEGGSLRVEEWAPKLPGVKRMVRRLVEESRPTVEGGGAAEDLEYPVDQIPSAKALGREEP